ncbi:hypothetical protein RJT34_19892 [Clitoria ternatea]|uniref:Uncharacterized protein n=1 Tax=Clitoria ternatea TaxID=43366 RepID=A0AAN9IRV8_CLITE
MTIRNKVLMEGSKTRDKECKEMVVILGYLTQEHGTGRLIGEGRESRGDLPLRIKNDKCCSKDSEGLKVLRVRDFGSCFFTLGINIRNGCFWLQSSQNIVVSSTLLEYEEALNQRSMTAAEVFTGLRIFRLLASLPVDYGALLQVYEHGFNAVKISENVTNGSTTLMGFPDCGSSYFLLLQIDKDLKPLFKLFKTQPSGKDNLFSNLNQVLLIKKIDIGQMQGHEDEMFLSLVDWIKFPCIFSNAAGPNQASGFEFLSDICVDKSTDSYSAVDVTSKNNNKSQKRIALEMLDLIPSLEGVENGLGICKRRKISDSAGCQFLIAEMNPSSIYIVALLHVVRHCSVWIKHARLTSQMDELGIPYVEEVCLGSASSNICFQLPFARGDQWQHICLRLGRPGCMYWDAKIKDQHFRDLFELQNGSTKTPWGSDVQIVNTSDLDSHIHCDLDGVVLSYQSVKVDSLKKLVGDIQRLANMRTFALCMRKLLGARGDGMSEDVTACSDAKTFGAKAASDTADKLSEQMSRAFRIEAVGLMSMLFSFGSGALDRVVFLLCF